MWEKFCGMSRMKRLGLAVLSAFVFFAAATAVINGWVMFTVQDDILTDDVATVEAADCILVLGAGIIDENTPNHMLKERLDTGIALYKAGAAPKLLLSGDNGQEGYNEVRTMKNYSLKAGVPEADIFLDHAGFSTYESAYRARDVFSVKKMIVVTQKYHMYRALYDAKALGIEAYGVPCDKKTYEGQLLRELRELMGRNKDFILGIVQPEPAYLGDAIPISGNGLQTEEK